MSMMIKDLNSNTRVENLLALISSLTEGKTTAGAPYLSITLQDSSSSIECKLWDATPEQIATFKAKQVVIVNGEVVSYRGSNQLKITAIMEVKENIDYTKLVTTAPYSKGDMESQIRSCIENIKNPIIKELTVSLYSEHLTKYMTYPAASKNHHEYTSGLAHHVYGMLELGNTLCNLYPALNRDLIYSGVILHDIGKTIELSGEIFAEYTLEGKLLGHISIANALIKEKANQLGFGDSEEVVVLQHMILSHHGKLEFGSPVLPLVREAEILNFIDNIDARMNMFDKVLENVNDGEFSSRVFSLENRSFYKPKF